MKHKKRYAFFPIMTAAAIMLAVLSPRVFAQEHSDTISVLSAHLLGGVGTAKCPYRYILGK